jgi:allantoinase
MAKRTVITGGTIVTDYGQFRADVLIVDGRIAGLTTDEALADERIDATGLWVMPGGIDAHTHFEEPDPNLLEGFTTGGAGAAAGGITTVVEMPQAHPTTTTVAHLREKKELVRRNAIVDMALWAGVIGEPAQPSRELRDLAKAGAAGFKSFMASSSPFFPAVDHAQLLTAMRTIAELDLPYALHAEDAQLLAAGLRDMRDAGRTDALAHAESRPPLVETVAVGTALHLAAATSCRVHICHAAAADALRLVADARSRGVRVTVETCPQYLTLNTDDLVRLKGFARCAPALREQQEVDAIWPYVLDGTVDYVCSDHSPYLIETKQAGDADIFEAPMGLSGIETLVPSFFDASVVQRGMDPSQFVRQISTNAARLFGLYPRKGTIAPGADADLVLFDPEQRWTVTGAELHHRQRWSPWEGRTLTGRVLTTLRRGETIFTNGQVVGAAGSGRLVDASYGRSSAC